MKFKFNKKQIIFLLLSYLLGYLLCVAVTYFLDEKIFIMFGYDVSGSMGRYVISDPMKYHIGALLLLILWELKKLNAKFSGDKSDDNKEE